MNYSLRRLLILTVMSLSFSFGIAQINDENTIIINSYFDNLNQEIKDNVDVNSIEFNEITTDKGALLSLYQIGVNNNVNINSDLNQQKVTQIGRNNNYEFIGFYGVNTLNLSVLQYGHGNSIEILGENSIMNNLKIIQNSNYSTIRINNF